ncbi:hypothetical protein EVA_12279 [gut metagenome]|uniref:Uncharacterized protein n=1 Tax=gut metagenome TaxID=749906 RepID=J9GJ73_9ZZZZ
MVFKLQATHAVSNALDRVLNRVRKVVQGIDAPCIALTMMMSTYNAVDSRVAQVHVRACHVNLGTQSAATIGKFTRTHAAEQIQVFLRCAVAPGAGSARLGQSAAIFLHFLATQIAHISLAFLDELLSVLIALLKIITAIVDSTVGNGTQPAQIFLNALDIFVVLTHRIGVVKTQIEFTSISFGDAPVNPDGLGAADVQVAIGFGWKTGMNLVYPAFCQVGIDDLSKKIAWLFHACSLLYYAEWSPKGRV